MCSENSLSRRSIVIWRVDFRGFFRFGALRQVLRAPPFNFFIRRAVVGQWHKPIQDFLWRLQFAVPAQVFDQALDVQRARFNLVFCLFVLLLAQRHGVLHFVLVQALQKRGGGEGAVKLKFTLAYLLECNQDFFELERREHFHHIVNGVLQIFLRLKGACCAHGTYKAFQLCKQHDAHLFAFRAQSLLNGHAFVECTLRCVVQHHFARVTDQPSELLRLCRAEGDLRRLRF